MPYQPAAPPSLVVEFVIVLLGRSGSHGRVACSKDGRRDAGTPAPAARIPSVARLPAAAARAGALASSSAPAYRGRILARDSSRRGNLAGVPNGSFSISASCRGNRSLSARRSGFAPRLWSASVGKNRSLITISHREEHPFGAAQTHHDPPGHDKRMDPCQKPSHFW